MPGVWTMELIQSIYKKRGKLQCSNYRPITLLNRAYKVLSAFIYNKMHPCAESILGVLVRVLPQQINYEQLYTKLNTRKNLCVYRPVLYIFINFKPAFDSI